MAEPETLHFTPSAVFMSMVDDAKKRIKEISIEDLQKRLKTNAELVVVDIREHSEYQAGHLEGAKYIPRGVLELYLEKVVPDQRTELVLYCCGGLRSSLAADTAMKMGYKNVMSLAGGFRELLHGGMNIKEIEDPHDHYYHNDYSL